jgi:hypothetical protein
VCVCVCVNVCGCMLSCHIILKTNNDKILKKYLVKIAVYDVCMYDAYMYICTYENMQRSMRPSSLRKDAYHVLSCFLRVRMYECMYACVYVFMYACMYVCMQECILHKYTHINPAQSPLQDAQMREIHVS